MTFPMTATNDMMTIFLKGQAYRVSKDHQHISKIVGALRDGGVSEDDLIAIITEKPLENPELHEYCSGDDRIKVVNSKVYIDGEEVPTALSNRINKAMQEQFPVKYLMAWYDRMEQNPSFSSKMEGYQFAEHENLPITWDGYLLAYKAIQSDWTDKHTGKISNRIGTVISMDRNKVDDNRSAGCSKGLHAGALPYIRTFGGGSDRIVIVKIDPKDIVCVPHDSSHHKIRVCRYEVIGEYQGPLTSSVYGSKGEVIEPDVAPMGTAQEDYGWDDVYDECDIDCYHPDDVCEDNEEGEFDALDALADAVAAEVEADEALTIPVGQLAEEVQEIIQPVVEAAAEVVLNPESTVKAKPIIKLERASTGGFVGSESKDDGESWTDLGTGGHSRSWWRAHCKRNGYKLREVRS